MKKTTLIFPPESLFNIIDNIINDICKQYKIEDKHKSKMKDFYLFGACKVLDIMSYNAGDIAASVFQKYFRYRIQSKIKEQRRDIAYTVFLEKLIENKIIKRVRYGKVGEFNSLFHLGENAGAAIKFHDVNINDHDGFVNLDELKNTFNTTDNKNFKRIVQKQINDFENLCVNFNRHSLVEFGIKNKIPVDSQIKHIYNLLRIQNKRFFATYTTSQRLYTSVTTLKSEYKQFLYFKEDNNLDEKDRVLYEVDIKNSQPIIAVSLFKDWAHTEEQKQEVQHLIKIVESGQFYEYLIIGLKKFLDKERAKEDFIDYSILGLTDNKYNSFLKSAQEYLQKTYPNDFCNNSDIRKMTKQFTMWVFNGDRCMRSESNDKDYSALTFNIDKKNYEKNVDNSVLYKIRRMNQLRANEVFALTFPNFFNFISTFKPTEKDKDILKILKDNPIKNTLEGWDASYELAKDLEKVFWYKLQLRESNILWSSLQNYLNDNIEKGIDVNNIKFLTIHDSLLGKHNIVQNIKKYLEIEIKQQTGISVVLEPKKLD